MNGRFRRMLEPGERILVRSTDGKTTWYLAGAFILLGSIWVRTIWGGEFLGFRFWMVPLVFMICAPLVTAAAWLSTRWKWVITDQRVLKLSSPEIAEMRHENVEEVQLRDKALSIHGRDCQWEFKITRGFCRADILYDLFGARFGDPGLPAGPLEEMLEPGETILWRGIPLVTNLLPWVILFSGPPALAVRLAWPEFSRGFFPGLGEVMIFYIIFLEDAVAFWRRRGWQTAITNRRLLRRRPEAPSRCDIIALDRVTGARWDRWNWSLVIISPGRCDRTFCLPWTARRILDTLERNDRGEALA